MTCYHWSVTKLWLREREPEVEVKCILGSRQTRRRRRQDGYYSTCHVRRLGGLSAYVLPSE